MTRRHRPPRAEEVNVAITVRIRKVGATSAGYKRRMSTHSAESAYGRIDAAGKKLFGPLLQSLRLGKIERHGSSIEVSTSVHMGDC